MWGCCEDNGPGNEIPLAVFREIILCCGLHKLQAWQDSKPLSHTDCSCPNRRVEAFEELKQDKGIETWSCSQEYSWACMFVCRHTHLYKELVLVFPLKVANDEYKLQWCTQGSLLYFFLTSFPLQLLFFDLFPPRSSSLTLMLSPRRFGYQGHMLDQHFSFVFLNTKYSPAFRGCQCLRRLVDENMHHDRALQ